MVMRPNPHTIVFTNPCSAFVRGTRLCARVFLRSVAISLPLGVPIQILPLPVKLVNVELFPDRVCDYSRLFSLKFFRIRDFGILPFYLIFAKGKLQMLQSYGIAEPNRLKNSVVFSLLCLHSGFMLGRSSSVVLGTGVL